MGFPSEKGILDQMPTRRRKGVPGKSTLPHGFVHNPSANASGILNLLGSLVQQPLSLGQLASQQPLAITYPSSNARAMSSRASTIAPESVVSVLDFKA